MNALISRSRTVSKLLLSPTTTLYTSLFSTSSSLLHYRFSSTYHKSQHEKVSVWWDMENCAIPTGGKVFKIVESITEAVRVNGIMGPLQINAFGDISRLNPKTFSYAGVNLVHTSNGGAETADWSLLWNLMYWVSQNPPPAPVFLISGDGRFADVLHKLRRSNYNILLAGKDSKQIPDTLSSAASIMWHWDELAKSKNLLGMHLHQPPEKDEGQKSPKIGDSSNAVKKSWDFKRRRVPEAVLSRLVCIVHRYPEGVAITDLQYELEMSNVPVDEAYYGYGTLSRFVLALPHLVEVESRTDGEIFVRPPPIKISIIYSLLGKDLPQLDGSEHLPVTRWVDSGRLTVSKVVDVDTLSRNDSDLGMMCSRFENPE